MKQTESTLINKWQMLSFILLDLLFIFSNHLFCMKVKKKKIFIRALSVDWWWGELWNGRNKHWAYVPVTYTTWSGHHNVRQHSTNDPWRKQSQKSHKCAVFWEKWVNMRCKILIVRFSPKQLSPLNYEVSSHCTMLVLILTLIYRLVLCVLCCFHCRCH